MKIWDRFRPKGRRGMRMTDQQLANLKEHFVIKPDGAIELDLRSAAGSEAFKESLKKIKSHEVKTARKFG